MFEVIDYILKICIKNKTAKHWTVIHTWYPQYYSMGIGVVYEYKDDNPDLTGYL